MKILFIRHGETTDNLKGSKSPVLSKADLTEKGVQQAHELAHILKQYKIQKIYSSPMFRTQHTAEIASKETNIPFEIINDLHERNWGDWGDKTWGEVLEICCVA
ncbi:MAG: histidine phosphatase family protein [Nanoarchaeota archaeon]